MLEKSVPMGWSILSLFFTAILAGCSQGPPPNVTLQAALPTPTLEPTFTRIPPPTIMVIPDIPEIGATSQPAMVETGTPAIALPTVSGETLPVPGKPQPGEQASQRPRVMLVLDVSRSMGSLVLPGELPAGMAALRAKLEQLENDPEYLRLGRQLSAILADPTVEAAYREWTEAATALDNWLAEKGYGQGQLAISDQVAALLADSGCDATYDAFIAYSSGSLAELDEQLSTACPAVTLNENQRQAIKKVLAYIEQPDYQALRAAETKLYEAYAEARNALGYQEVREQFRVKQNSRDYTQLQAEFEKLAQSQDIPSRLDLARLAVRALLDLSRLDTLASGRESPIGMVNFSNSAALLQPLTTNYSQIEAQLDQLQPLYETNIGAGLNAALAELVKTEDLSQPAAIILLSDGHSNQSASLDEILNRIPAQANKVGVRICTVGLANDESQVDVGLMQRLAEATSGQYLFATTAQELASFFITCRQGVVSPLVDQFAGVARSGEIVEAGQIDVRDDVGELTLTFNYLQGRLAIELVDAEGNVIDDTYPGVTIEQGQRLQLVKVTNPRPGEWIVRVTAPVAPPEGVLYNIVVNTAPRLTPPPP